MTRIALCLIVKPSDEEAIVLDRCLAEASKHTDGIYLTITGRNEACENVAQKYSAVVSHFEWIHDFAAARNFALAQIPTDFTHWTWLDCDDVPRNYDKLKPTIDAHPEVDGFIFNYLYAFDEWKNPIVVHAKARAFKHDGCVKWVGALHEDFSFERDITSFFVEGIDVLHLSDSKRTQDSAARNVEVAMKDLERKPDDPRSYWNAGNSLKGVGKLEEAAEMFAKFMALSHSEDEKFVAHTRMAELRQIEGNKEAALDHARYAIGMRPEFPEGYNIAGHVMFSMERYSDAAEMFKLGLKKKPAYHRAIVFNPRDYDLNPMMALAKCYFQLSLPQLALPLVDACFKITPNDKELEKTVKLLRTQAEKMDKILEEVKRISELEDNEELRHAIAALPDDFRSHPAVCHLRNQRLVKTESSGRDLSIYCSFTEEEWTPETAKTKGIGGSEEAVIHLSQRLAARGWNVTVFNNCGHKALTFDGVTYRPFWEWNYRDKQDVVILWRHPKAVDAGINCDRVYLDLHDVVPAAEFTLDRLSKITKIFVKSKAHRALFPKVPDEKFEVIPNGIVWEDLQNGLKRDPMLMVNTSSPDRSLSTLVELYARVKERVPAARLKWCYGWFGWDNAHGDDPAKVEWKTRLKARMDELGIEDLGRVSHGEVAKLYQQANVFAYPTAFYEIDCISARKAQAAGAVPVVSDFAALAETVQYGEVFHVKQSEENWGKPGMFDFAMMGEEAKNAWVEGAVRQLLNPQTEDERVPMREWTKQFSWEAITDRWNETINL